MFRFARFLMEEADAPATAGAKPTPPAPAPTPPAAPAPGEEFKGMTKEQFNERLAKQTEAGQKAALKEFGFKDLEEAKTFFEAARKEADAKKSEQQKKDEKIAALEPLAVKASTYEKTIQGYLAAEEAAIPEDKKALLDLAPPAEDFAARLDWIAKAKAKGLFAATAAPAAPTTPPPANSRAGQGNPPAPTVPSPKHPREMTPDEFRQYERQQLAAHTTRK